VAMNSAVAIAIPHDGGFLMESPMRNWKNIVILDRGLCHEYQVKRAIESGHECQRSFD
jgi:hypothetical protein